METHDEWVGNKGWHIQNLSPDLQWVIARQYREHNRYTDKAIFEGNIIAEAESTLSEVGTYFRIKETGQGCDGLINSEMFEQMENIMNEMEGYTYIWYLEDATCMDGYGRLLIISEPDSQGIRIYSTEDWSLKKRIAITNIDTDYPLAISQFSGTEESGWLVFSNGQNISIELSGWDIGTVGRIYV